MIYQSILTNAGLNQQAAGTLAFNRMVFGDGAEYDPTGSETALKNQRHVEHKPAELDAEAETLRNELAGL